MFQRCCRHVQSQSIPRVLTRNIWRKASFQVYKMSFPCTKHFHIVCMFEWHMYPAPLACRSQRKQRCFLERWWERPVLDLSQCNICPLYMCPSKCLMSVMSFIISVLLTLPLHRHQTQSLTLTHTQKHTHYSTSRDQRTGSWTTNIVEIYSVFLWLLIRSLFFLVYIFGVCLCVAIAGARDRLHHLCMNSLIPDLLGSACARMYYRVCAGANSGEIKWGERWGEVNEYGGWRKGLSSFVTHVELITQPNIKEHSFLACSFPLWSCVLSCVLSFKRDAMNCC